MSFQMLSQISFQGLDLVECIYKYFTGIKRIIKKQDSEKKMNKKKKS